MMICNSFNTSSNPTRAIIALHGWTGDVHSMDPIVKSIKIPNTKWILPQAPYISEKQGFTWFQGSDETGWLYKKSFNILSNLIENLVKEGFNYNDIFMIGFSQGACLTKEYLIRQSFSIGGIIPVAGFIRYKEKFLKDSTSKSKNTRIFLIHGKKDKVVLPIESEQSYNLFNSLGYSVQLALEPVGHKIPLRIKGEIRRFIINQS